MSWILPSFDSPVDDVKLGCLWTKFGLTEDVCDVIVSRIIGSSEIGVGTSGTVEIFVPPPPPVTDALLPALCNDSLDDCFFNGLGGTVGKKENK